MPAAILNQGKLKIRNSLKTLVTHVGITDDNAAFAAGQTTLNPTGGATTVLVKAATKADVDNDTFDASITIDGSTEFTNKNIFAVGVLDGSSATNAISRSVRTLPVGVQAGDIFTVAVRMKVEDNS